MVLQCIYVQSFKKKTFSFPISNYFLLNASQNFVVFSSHENHINNDKERREMERWKREHHQSWHVMWAYLPIAISNNSKLWVLSKCCKLCARKSLWRRVQKLKHRNIECKAYKWLSIDWLFNCSRLSGFQFKTLCRILFLHIKI